MKFKKSQVVILLAICLAANVSARVPVKHTKKGKKENFKLIEAYTQRTRAGIPGAPSPTNNHFILIWEASAYPETFFWRGENGFLTCKIEKVHKISKKQANNFPPGMEYTTEDVTLDQLHKGDTIELTALMGGKYAVPKEVPASAKNTLYYKTGGSGWLSFPVTKITKKQDMVMQ